MERRVPATQPGDLIEGRLATSDARSERDWAMPCNWARSSVDRRNSALGRPRAIDLLWLGERSI